jgi:hypothetical protein
MTHQLGAVVKPYSSRLKRVKYVSPFIVVRDG